MHYGYHNKHLENSVGPILWRYAVVHVCSTDGEDFLIIDNSVSFDSGLFPGALRCFLVGIFEDSVAEDDETILLLLSSDNGLVDPQRDVLLVTIRNGNPIYT